MSDPSPRIPVMAGSTGHGRPATPWDRLRRFLGLLASDDHSARGGGSSEPPGTEQDQVPGSEGVRLLSRGLPDDPEQYGAAEELAERAGQELRALGERIDCAPIHQDSRIAASLCLIGAADLGHRLRLELWGRYGVPERRRIGQRSSRNPAHRALAAEVDKVTARAVALLHEARETECGNGLLVGPWGERLRLVGGRLDEHFVRWVLLPKLLTGQAGPAQQGTDVDVGPDPVQILVTGQLAHWSGAVGPRASPRLRWLPHLVEAGRGCDKIMAILLADHPEASRGWFRRLWGALWGEGCHQDAVATQEKARRGLDVVRNALASRPPGALRLLAASWDRIAFVDNALARSQLALEFVNQAVKEAGVSGPQEDPEVSAELELMHAVLGVWAQPPHPLNRVTGVAEQLEDRPLLARGYAPYLALTLLHRCEYWPLDGPLLGQARTVWDSLARGLVKASSASLRLDPYAWMEILASTKCPTKSVDCCSRRGTHVWHLCLQTARFGWAEAPTVNPFFVPLRAGNSEMPTDTFAGIALEAFLSDGNTVGEYTKSLRNCLRRHNTGLTTEQLQWAVGFLPPGTRQQVWNGYRPREGTAGPAVTSGKDAS